MWSSHLYNHEITYSGWDTLGLSTVALQDHKYLHVLPN